MDNLYISALCNYRLNELHGQILMANPLAFQVPNRAGRQAAQLSVGAAAVGDSAEIGNREAARRRLTDSSRAAAATITTTARNVHHLCSE